MRIGEGKPGFFAIASPPDPNNAGVVELLVKSVPDTASEQLAATKAGTPARPPAAPRLRLSRRGNRRVLLGRVPRGRPRPMSLGDLPVHAV